MFYFKLKTHQFGRTYKQPHVFLLSRGENSGKPLQKECKNCFVVQTNHQEEANRIYWMAYALWKTNQFSRLLKGSVIPFIDIKSLEKELKNNLQKHQDQGKFEKLLEALKVVDLEEKRIQERTNFIHNLKLSVLYNMVS
jgi:hypothetical protein